MSPAQPLSLNPSMRVEPFDSASLEPMVLCEVPAADRRTSRFAVPRTIWEFASTFDGRTSTADLVSSYCATHPSHTSERLERLVDGFLVARGVLVGDRPVQTKRATRSSYLGLRVALIPSSVVNVIGRGLGVLFRREAVLPALVATIAVQAWFFFGVRPHATLSSKPLTGGDALIVMGLVSFGSLIHELGHATAGVRYGCRKITIGWGVYWYFMVLYTDLSEAWRLTRRQRVVLDVAGVYFQLLYLCAITVWYHETGWRLLLYCILLSDLAIASYVSPFFRLDGYWLVSDSLGIANLRQQAGALMARAVVMIRRPDRRGDAAIGLGLDRRATIALTAYAVASVGFFAWMWFAVLSRFGATLFATYPETLGRLWLAVAHRAGALHIFLAVVDLTWRSMAVVGICLFFYRGGRALLVGARRVVAGLRAPRTDERPIEHERIALGSDHTDTITASLSS